MRSGYTCRLMNGILNKTCGCYKLDGGFLQGVPSTCSAVILIDPLFGTESWVCNEVNDSDCECPAMIPDCKAVSGVTEGQTLVAPTQACSCQA